MFAQVPPLPSAFYILVSLIRLLDPFQAPIRSRVPEGRRVMPPVLSLALLPHHLQTHAKCPGRSSLPRVTEWHWTLAEERRDCSVDWGMGPAVATTSCLSIWRSHFKRIYIVPTCWPPAHLPAKYPCPLALCVPSRGNANFPGICHS